MASITISRTSISLACAGLLALSACGGGGGGEDSPRTPVAVTPTPTAPETVSVMSRVVDGPIRGAKVCLDINRNGACDDGEPFALSGDTGNVEIKVQPSDAGKYPLVAEVGTTAFDVDTGAVPVAFTLSTPADKPGLISPLTTMVHRVVLDTGVSSADADAALRSQTGLTTSLFDDFSVDTTVASRVAATTARLVVRALQDQLTTLAPVVGTTDLSGASVVASDLALAVQRNLSRTLADIVAAALLPSVQSACGASLSGAACVAAIQSGASGVIATSGLTVGSAPLAVASGRMPEGPATTATAAAPGASLEALSFGDGSNWFYRAFVSTAAENTPDANGKVRFRSIYRNLSAGVLTEWSRGGSYSRRDDTHWNGTQWVTCPLGYVNSQDVRDANGRIANSVFCDGAETSYSQRNVLDVSGKRMAAIVEAIRASGAGYANFASPPAGYTGGGRANFGDAVLPAGSKLHSQTSTRIATAPTYDVTSTVIRYSSAVTAGGDVRTNASSACNSSETATNATIPSTTLEDLLSSFKGTPCIYAQSTFTSTASATPLSSGPTNEWWGNSTLSIGTVGSDLLVSNPTTYYTSNALIRFSFGSGNTVNYFSCKQRQVNGSPRNCTAIGSGTYSIATLGDARVLSLTGAPAETASFTYDRVMVERGGKVYYGYKTKLGAFTSTRLNLTAANALFGQLGMPAIVP